MAEHELETIAFPKLTESQVAQLRYAGGSSKSSKPGRRYFEPAIKYQTFLSSSQVNLSLSMKPEKSQKQSGS